MKLFCVFKIWKFWFQNEISQKDHDNGWKTLQFATTPIMSSYLVAYIVGDFEFVEVNIFSYFFSLNI